MNVIAYPFEERIAVVYPTGELPIEEVARKDVPAGIPYKIIPLSDVPTDPALRADWAVSFDSPDGHGIGAEAWFAEQLAVLEPG